MMLKLRYFIIPFIVTGLFLALLGCANMMSSEVEESIGIRTTGLAEQNAALASLENAEKKAYVGNSGMPLMGEAIELPTVNVSGVIDLVSTSPSILHRLLDARIKNDNSIIGASSLLSSEVTDMFTDIVALESSDFNVIDNNYLFLRRLKYLLVRTIDIRFYLDDSGLVDPQIQGVIARLDEIIVQLDANVVFFESMLGPPLPEEIPWNIKAVKAPTAWDVTKGSQNVKVAILSTGIEYTHQDLAANFMGGHDFVNNDTDPLDDHGIGTLIAGIIASAENGVGMIGMSPIVSIYALKTEDEFMVTFFSQIIDAIAWSVTNNIDILYLTFATAEDFVPLETALQNAAAAGIIIVAPVGNTSGQVKYPAKYPEVIAVSWLDESLNIASFSNTGKEVEIAAPGMNIKSTYLGNSYTAIFFGGELAGAHVVGALALAKAANPSLSAAQLRTLLGTTAQDLGLPAHQQGAGLVDAAALVNAAINQ